MIGIISGASIPKTRLVEDGKTEVLKTPYGVATLFFGEKAVFVRRHGDGIAPHRINHKANIWALKQYTERIVGVNSVGSLQKSILPGAIVIPDDYISFEPVTFFDDERKHITPALDRKTRLLILEAAQKTGYEVIDGGVYIQTRGPRLETRAEVRMYAGFADIVGMTMASEATLAQELGASYACLCSVDNMAHGLEGKKLDFNQIVKIAEENGEKIDLILSNLASELI